MFPDRWCVWVHSDSGCSGGGVHCWRTMLPELSGTALTTLGCWSTSAGHRPLGPALTEWGLWTWVGHHPSPYDQGVYLLGIDLSSSHSRQRGYTHGYSKKLRSLNQPWMESLILSFRAKMLALLDVNLSLCHHFYNAPIDFALDAFIGHQAGFLCAPIASSKH